MGSENSPEMGELFRESVVPSPRPRAFAVAMLFVVLSYAMVFALFCASVAFMSPEQRRSWTPELLAALFPVGVITFAISELTGGFLTAAAGLKVGNFGAAVPLFLVAFAIGVSHGSLLVAVTVGIRWAARRFGRWRGRM